MVGRRALAALMLPVAVAALAGCGQSVGKHVVAAKLLSSANSSATHTSLSASFELKASVSLTGASGLSSSELQELHVLETDLNSADLTGAVDVQDSSHVEGSLSLTPLLSQPVRFIEVSGVEYINYDGGGWHRAGSAQGGSAALPSSPASIPSFALSLGNLAKHETTVTNLGPTTLDGSAVDHLRAVVSGPGLDKILQAALGDLGTANISSAQASELASLIQFGRAQGDSYLLTSSGLPMQESGSAQLSLNLSTLSLLDPRQAAVTGIVNLNFSGRVDFSHYGANFAIAAPTTVAAGPAKMPPGLSQFF